MNDQTPQEARGQLLELIKDNRIAMVTTMTQDGQHIGRPMAVQQVEPNGDLWFFTSKSSRKAQHIQANPQVGVTFSDNKDGTWISVSGNAVLVEDKAKAEELWNPLLKAWFSDGVESPDLVLLKVQSEGAEYWDSPSSKVVTLFSMVKGAVTGKSADPGQNSTVDL